MEWCCQLSLASLKPTANLAWTRLAARHSPYDHLSSVNHRLPGKDVYWFKSLECPVVLCNSTVEVSNCNQWSMSLYVTHRFPHNSGAISHHRAETLLTLCSSLGPFALSSYFAWRFYSPRPPWLLCSLPLRLAQITPQGRYPNVI